MEPVNSYPTCQRRFLIKLREGNLKSFKITLGDPPPIPLPALPVGSVLLPQAGRNPAAKTVTKRMIKCWVRVVFMPVFSKRHQEQSTRAEELPVVRILNPAANNFALNSLGIRALFPGQYSQQSFNGDLIRRFPSATLVVAKLQRSDKPLAGVD
jgi:hypothetical protein